MHIVCIFSRTTEGGVWQGWNFGCLQIRSLATKKVQNNVFVSAALHGENGSKSDKKVFCLIFFQFLLMESKQNSIN